VKFGRAVIFIAAFVATLDPIPAVAQGGSPFLLRLHVSADEGRKTTALAALTAALAPVRDIELTDRDADYVLSLVVLPAGTGGYAISVIVMHVHTETSLDARGRQWGMGEADRKQMVALLKGAGALLDQRVVTGPDLAALCSDIARALSADILEPQRRFRAPSR
jgi:hypothetical protein